MKRRRTTGPPARRLLDLPDELLARILGFAARTTRCLQRLTCVCKVFRDRMRKDVEVRLGPAAFFIGGMTPYGFYKHAYLNDYSVLDGPLLEAILDLLANLERFEGMQRLVLGGPASPLHLLRGRFVGPRRQGRMFSPLARGFLMLTHLCVGELHYVNDEWCRTFLVQRGVNDVVLQYLDVSRCPNITDGFLPTLYQRHRALRTLRLAECPEITGVGLQSLGMNLPGMRMLSLKGTALTDEGLRAFSTGME